MTPDDTYALSLQHMTVLRITSAGEVIDLNATGDFIRVLHAVEACSTLMKCSTVEELRSFIRVLHAVDCIDADQMAELLAELTIEDLMAALVQA